MSRVDQHSSKKSEQKSVLSGAGQEAAIITTPKGDVVLDKSTVNVKEVKQENIVYDFVGIAG